MISMCCVRAASNDLYIPIEIYFEIDILSVF